MTALRFFAAAAVFCSHCSILQSGGAASVFLFNKILFNGFAGVGFFFTLSGFILTYVYQDTINIKKFYLNRFARIYPLHILTLFTVIVLYKISEVKALFLNIFLLQAFSHADAFTYNAPSWSLSCEFLFYSLFPYLILKMAKLSTQVITALLIFFVFLDFLLPIVLMKENINPDWIHYWCYLFPGARLIDFISGCCLGLIFIHRPYTIRLWQSMILSLLWIIILCTESNIPLPFRWSSFYLPYVLVLIYFFANLKKKCPKILIYLGEISFCFYLVHKQMGLVFISTIWQTPILGKTMIAYIVFSFIWSLIISIFLYELIEKPFRKKIRGLFKDNDTLEMINDSKQ